MADAVENEVNDYCFTIHDPITRQPEKPKLGFVLKTMLAIVRPGFTNDLLCARANKSSKFDELQKLNVDQMIRDVI